MSTRLPPDPEGSGSEPFHQLITSAARNFDLGEWSVNTRGMGLAGPFCSVSKRRLHGGRQEGVDLVTLDNGRIAITVIPTRGMGILKVESAEVSLGWDSPVKEVVHPQFVNLESRGGLGWLQGFNEWLVRCGLEFAGGPGKDRFITNTGEVSEMDLTLHGKIANIPASEVEVIIDRAPPFAIRLRGKVLESMFYGPKLELWTEISLEPNARAFRVQDTVTNRGGVDQEFELIYHVNFGAPLLEAGAQFLGPVPRVTPMNAHAAQTVKEYAVYGGPAVGYVEQVYCMRPRAGPDGRTTVLLKNAAGNHGASITYPIDPLPCFTLWKNTNLREEGYVTGLEPGTNFPNNRRVEREAGRVGKLRPGESRRFVLDIGIHSTREEVQETAAIIQRLQGSQPPQIDSAPAPI